MIIVESESSDNEEFLENVEIMELDENSASEYCSAEVLFVSNGSALIAQSLARESTSKKCPCCKGVEGARKRTGVLVEFDVNPKSLTGKKYALCRKCKAYADEVNNPKQNAKVCVP
jgi:hypothetical protein